MSQTILITGANSFIAGHLIPILSVNHRVKRLTRSPRKEDEYGWDIAKRMLDEHALDDVGTIVHLAGAKLNDGTPLTDQRKQLIYDTRVGAAGMLLDALKKRGQKIHSFVSASAIGYYGYTDSTLEIDENGEMGSDFSAVLSRDWEIAADAFKAKSIAQHVAKIRVSLVMGNEGGIFPFYRKMVMDQPMLGAH